VLIFFAFGETALRITEETERGDNDTIKQPKDARVMRGPREGGDNTAGVRRRRRNRKEEGEAQSSPVVGCCGGGAGNAARAA
jgi:hypothetical protein